MGKLQKYVVAVFLLVIILAGRVEAQVFAFDGAGNRLGMLISNFNGEPLDGPTGQANYWIVNQNNFQFVIYWPVFEGTEVQSIASLGSFARNGGLFFKSTECSGQAYAVARDTGFIYNPFQVGRYGLTSEAPEVWYVPHDEIIQRRTFNSRISTPGTCQALQEPSTLNFTARSFPNDADITAFVDPILQMPIKIKAESPAGLDDCLFRDSFQCSQH